MEEGEITDENAMLALMPSLLHCIAHATLTDNVVDFNNLLPGQYGSLSRFGVCPSEDGDHAGRDAWCRSVNPNFVIPGQPVAPRVAAPTPGELMLHACTFVTILFKYQYEKHQILHVTLIQLFEFFYLLPSFKFLFFLSFAVFYF